MPYETLAKFGLTREMIEDLPMHVLEDIGQGRRSPVLPIQVEDENENIIKSHTRFAFVRMEDRPSGCGVLSSAEPSTLGAV